MNTAASSDISGLAKCPGYVSTITSLGEMRIQLDADVVQDFDETLFNKENVLMFIDPNK